jgi:hypothetical protein
MNYHLKDPHQLKDKDFAVIAKIIKIQQEVEFFGMDWYDPTCYAVKILDANMKRFKLRML